MKKLKIALAIFSFTFITNIALAHGGEELRAQATQKTERLSNELNLTEEQKEKVFDVIHGIIMKNDGVNHSNLSAAEKTSIIASNKEAQDGMLKEILTPAQYTKYTKL